MQIEQIVSDVKDVIKKHLPEEEWKVLLFGSQAQDTARETSDIDMGILGKTEVPRDIMARIRDEVDALPTLRSVDIVDLNGADKNFRERVLKTAKFFE